jgi:hypothetical protein
MSVETKTKPLSIVFRFCGPCFEKKWSNRMSQMLKAIDFSRPVEVKLEALHDDDSIGMFDILAENAKTRQMELVYSKKTQGLPTKEKLEALILGLKQVIDT